MGLRKSLFEDKGDSFNLAQVKKSLTGSIVLHLEEKDNLGYFQLKKDPQPFLVQPDHFIHKSEKLMGTSWVLGIVVSLGKDCKYFRISKSNETQVYKNRWYVTLYILITVKILVTLLI